jgi:predicted TIM-barrel fold metal-dependent hydrolase
MIIDAHAHLGADEVFDEDFTEEELLESQARNGIQVTLVQPGTVHDLDRVQHQHDRIADLASRYPGRFRGIANPNPHLPDGQYEREVRRCIGELGFIGLKVHPLAHAVNPLGDHGRRAFALARELAIPVMVHTGAGLPWAAPSLLDPIAEEHPGLQIVVAHAGGMLAAEAGLLAARRPNVYLEVSWLGGYHVRAWVHRFGARRLLFGSDHADNAGAELAKLRGAGLTEEELAWVLGRSAAGLFGLGRKA